MSQFVPTQSETSAPLRHGRRWIRAAFLKLTRTLHIYLSLLGLVMMTFFSVTGFMLNHDAWFDRDTWVTRSEAGDLPVSLFHAPVDKLAVSEALRARFHISGVLDEFTCDSDEIDVRYKAFGRRTAATIDPKTGKVELKFESRGLIGRLTDLHMGTDASSDAGGAWRRVIDAVAILIALSALTGVMMWWHLPKRRRLGIAALFLGMLASLAVYLLLVP